MDVTEFNLGHEKLPYVDARMQVWNMRITSTIIDQNSSHLKINTFDIS